MTDGRTEPTSTDSAGEPTSTDATATDAVSAGSATIDFTSTAPTTGSLDVTWMHGVRSARREQEPAIQVHHYDEHTVILRQSKSVNYEAPFLYLLFGNDRAFLLDTGATADPALFPLRTTIDGLITAWLDQHPCEGYELVVAHSHGHGDHVAADPQFADRPATTVVPQAPDEVRSFFGFGDNWPAQSVTFDLGGRVLEVLGSPGHHQSAVTFYDPWTGFLLTGDTVLPGRLFAFDFPAYLATVERLVAFAETRPVTHVLGCHVEMTNRRGRDYPLGAGYQPDERAPEMTTAQLTAIRDAASTVASHKGVHRFDDFVILNEPGKGDLRRLLFRARAHKFVSRLRFF
jgi:glyoxylase-like metal-dependent hydrolase (beta-lactamase superfamily II)